MKSSQPRKQKHIFMKFLKKSVFDQVRFSFDVKVSLSTLIPDLNDGHSPPFSFHLSPKAQLHHPICQRQKQKPSKTNGNRLTRDKEDRDENRIIRLIHHHHSISSRSKQFQFLLEPHHVPSAVRNNHPNINAQNVVFRIAVSNAVANTRNGVTNKSHVSFRNSSSNSNNNNKTMMANKMSPKGANTFRQIN